MNTYGVYVKCMQWRKEIGIHTMIRCPARQLLYFPSRAGSGMRSGSDLVAFSDFLGSAQLLVILWLRSLPGFTAGQTTQFCYYKLHESHQQGISLS